MTSNCPETISANWTPNTQKKENGDGHRAGFEHQAFPLRAKSSPHSSSCAATKTFLRSFWEGLVVVLRGLGDGTWEVSTYTMMLARKVFWAFLPIKWKVRELKFCWDSDPKCDNFLTICRVASWYTKGWWWSEDRTQQKFKPPTLSTFKMRQSYTHIRFLSLCWTNLTIDVLQINVLGSVKAMTFVNKHCEPLMQSRLSTWCGRVSIGSLISLPSFLSFKISFCPLQIKFHS